jgi:hypothetical protein
MSKVQNGKTNQFRKLAYMNMREHSIESLKPKIVEVLSSAMKNQSKCDCVNLEDPEVKKILLHNDGGFDRLLKTPNLRIVVRIRWNKKKMFFGCSVACLTKQKDGSWKCEIRFDDNHECRHLDVDSPIGRTKIIDGRLALIKVECPILSELINSLSNEKANTWKTKLFQEIVIGNQKHKEHLNNPERIHLH